MQEYENKIEYREKRLESVSAERDKEQDRDRKTKEQWWKVTKYIDSSAVLRYTNHISEGIFVVFTPLPPPFDSYKLQLPHIFPLSLTDCK